MMLQPRVLPFSAIAGVALCLNASALLGQAVQAPRAGTVVFSQNKCPAAVVGRLNAAVDSVFAPILNQMVSEGRLIDWGILEHSWGDEWNWNVWYSATNHRAFLDFWSEYIRRMNQQHPGWFDRYATLCTDHKDNIYAVRQVR